MKGQEIDFRSKCISKNKSWIYMYYSAKVHSFVSFKGEIPLLANGKFYRTKVS